MPRISLPSPLLCPIGILIILLAYLGVAAIYLLLGATLDQMWYYLLALLHLALFAVPAAKLWKLLRQRQHGHLSLLRERLMTERLLHDEIGI